MAGTRRTIAIGIAVLLIRKSVGDAERAKQAQADLNAVTVERAEAKGASDDELDKEVTRGHENTDRHGGDDPAVGRLHDVARTGSLCTAGPIILDTGASDRLTRGEKDRS